MSPSPPSSTASVRLDIWLDVACLFPTRTASGKAIRGGKVSVNGQSAKPNRMLRAGDRIEISSPGRHRILEVRGVADRHVPKAEARTMYEDLTPPPSAEDVAMRRALHRDPGAGRPSSRERRVLRKIRGR